MQGKRPGLTEILTSGENQKRKSRRQMAREKIIAVLHVWYSLNRAKLFFVLFFVSV